MRTLAFDGRTGAAGDMICAALIAAGADPAVLDPVEDALPVRYEVGETTRNSIRATTVDVLLAETDGGHSHDHHDHGEADHRHGHGEDDHTHQHAEGSGVHRTYPEVVEAVEAMDLPTGVAEDALAVFELLAEAEAAVHGTDLAETHFHEVGADDALADVVGACLLLDDLDPDRVVTGPVAAGGGEVEMSHGVYPVPAPAVVEVAERSGLALRGGPVESELLTPTGAAILGALAEPVAELPAMTVEAAGYGAGRKSFPEHPNVLRAVVGEAVPDGGDDAADPHAPGDHGRDHGDTDHGGTHGRGDTHGHDATRDHGNAHGHDAAERGRRDAGLVRDDVAVLETNLDDAPPEVLGGLQETLSDAGALDVTVLPTTMKKSRPGHLVKVVCEPGDAAAVAERLARETGTLGVRESAAGHRWIAERAFETAEVVVDGETHEVAVKVASTADGEVYDRSAEYDDAAAVARETDLPIREVMRRAENAAGN
ncbi:hypothetical protein GCM10027435_07740 [Haloparvum alkalitolerans]|uniref:nickel pincer cofactor biosynthesis protein LarC n=1 Tax=Haloparvum alkalitolerans TaxID=1042953 RepID=UPI003CE6B84A